MLNGLSKLQLESLYIERRMSLSEIAYQLDISVHKVAWWMEKYNIPRRNKSEAAYAKQTYPKKAFSIKPIRSRADAQLLGLGLGLYWGEGNKANRYSVRLGNTNPELIKSFIKFLIEICDVQKSDLRFGLQIFTDIEPQIALNYWKYQLGVSDSQFYKITVTISGSIGTYRQKSQYGVLTVYYNNKRLRDILVNMLP